MAFFRSDARIRREAADWITRLGPDADKLPAGDFRRWYEENPRHAEAYHRIAGIYSAAAQAESAPAEQVRARPQPERRTVRYALAASLAVALALVPALLLTNWFERAGPHAQTEHRLAFATAVGETREIELPEGSRLLLGSSSRVEGRFTFAERRLVLREGRARFTVAPEARRFIVAAAMNEIIATGTVFDVSLIGGRTAIMLLQGSVDVRQSAPRGPGNLHRLSAGQKLVISNGASGSIQSPRRGDTAWPGKMLEFDDTPLEDAVAQMGRYSRVRLRLADEPTRRLRVSGAYRAGDVSGFARGLSAAFGLRLETLADGSFLLAQPKIERP